MLPYSGRNSPCLLGSVLCQKTRSLAPSPSAHLLTEAWLGSASAREAAQPACPAGVPSRRETDCSGCAGSSALRSEACTWLACHALLPPSQTKESPASAPSQQCSQTSMVLSAALKQCSFPLHWENLQDMEPRQRSSLKEFSLFGQILSGQCHRGQVAGL